MADKTKNQKNYAVVTVVTGLTKNQAGNLVGEIVKAKNKVAPNARVTGGQTTKEKIGQLLQEGWRLITGEVENQKN